jgi:Phage tail tube protein
MSDTNRVGVRIARDSTRNAPLLGTARNLQALRYTGAPGLAFTPTTVVSEEIRSDRQTSDLILVGGEAGGDTNFELSFRAFDLLIESALMAFYTQSAFQEGTGAGGIASFGAGTITVDTGDGARYLAGHLTRLTDLSVGDPGGGVYEVASIAVDTITAAAFTADTNALAAAFTAVALSRFGIVGMRATANGDITMAAPSGGEIVMSFGAAMNSLFDNARDTGVPLAAGEWLKMSGWTVAGNNVWARIKAIDTTARTITFDAQTGMAVDAAAAARVELYYGDTVENGTGAVSAHQFAVERRFEDQSPVLRELFTGMALNNFSLNLQPQAIAKGAVTFFGFNSAVAEEGSHIGTVAPALYENAPVDLAAPTNDVYNTSNNVGRLGRGVDAIDALGVNFVLEASIELTNNLRRDPAVGVFGAANIGAGEVGVTGTLRTYFDNKDILEQINTNAETSVDLSVVDNSGQAMLFDMPRIKFSGGAPDVPGKNQSVTINATYQAILSPDYGYTISVQRFFFSR